jgi:anti-sigma factor RsiW
MMRDRQLTIHRRRFLATAAALVMMVGAGMWLVVGGGDEKPGPSRFAELLVSDFEHFLEEGSRVQFASTDAQAVADWLRERTALAVVLPVSAGSRAQLVGCRKCKIAGQPAAFAIYEMDRNPVSLVAVAADGQDLEGMQEVRRDDATCWIDDCRGHAVVACRVGELVYAAVSILSEKELLSWMTETKREGR